MTRFIAVASSKGGTGKTTTSLNLGLALTNFGTEAVVVDGNFHAPHIGLHLGSTSNEATLHHALKGKAKITDAVYSHSSGLKIVPLHIGLQEFREADTSSLKDVLMQMNGRCDAVIVDCPPSLGKEAGDIFKACSEVILVTTPDMMSVTEALKTKQEARRHGAQVIGAVLNRVRKDSIEMHVRNVEQMLGIPVIEIIPEDDNVRHAMHMRHPVAYSHPGSEASSQFRQLAAKLLGKRYAEKLEEEDIDSAYNRVLEALGFR